MLTASLSPFVIGAVTGAAEALASVAARVLFGVLVSSRAMRLDGILQSTVATPYVLGVRDPFKVVGPSAKTVTTEVVAFQPGRRLTPKNMMGQDDAVASATNAKLSIAVFIGHADPDGATIGAAGVDLRPEANKQGSIVSGHGNQPSCVMEPGADTSRLPLIIQPEIRS